MYNRACVSSVNVAYVCSKNKKDEAVKKQQQQKKNNQSSSSLGSVTKVIQRFYQ